MTSKIKNATATAGDVTQPQVTPPRLKCGLIMPISKSQGLEPEHWLHVKGIICEALADTAFDVRLVSESDDVGVIHKSIVQNIYQNDIVICDVSTHNANVMFELGLRLAFDKPTVIIKDDETPFSFDTQVIEHLVYKRSLHYVDIVLFKKKLKDKVLATMNQSKDPDFSTFLKHFTINYVAKIDERTVSINEVFIERLEQMQKSINSIYQSTNKRKGFVLGNENEDYDDNLENIPLKLKDTVQLFLDDYLDSNDIKLGDLIDHLSSLSSSNFDLLIPDYYSFLRSTGLSQKIAPPPPHIIRNELLKFTHR